MVHHGTVSAAAIIATRPLTCQVLGAKRKTLAGFSSTTAQPHQGFIFSCPIMQQTPPSLRIKAARLLGGKCALLARVDAFGQDPSVSNAIMHAGPCIHSSVA